MLTSPSARVRRAAVGALRILGIEGQEQILLRLVSSDVPPVAREAASSLLSGRSLAADAVWAAALTNTDKRVHLVVLRLLRSAGKWQQLRLFLEAADSIDPKLSECSVGMLTLWIRKFNSTFVQPTVADTEASLKLMEAVRTRLPDSLASELRFILKTGTRDGAKVE